MFTREQAKIKLKRHGYSYRSVAPVLGVTYQHLSEVLNGRRHSIRLLQSIARLTVARLPKRS